MAYIYIYIYIYIYDISHLRVNSQTAEITNGLTQALTASTHHTLRTVHTSPSSKTVVTNLWLVTPGVPHRYCKVAASLIQGPWKSTQLSQEFLLPQPQLGSAYYYYYYYYHHHHHHRISHFSASAGKHSPILWYVINRNMLGGLICNLKSFLKLNMFQELQIFSFLCTYWDAG
jgi:hypothetical protein